VRRWCVRAGKDPSLGGVPSLKSEGSSAEMKLALPRRPLLVFFAWPFPPPLIQPGRLSRGVLPRDFA
jgi:hypothetical protein